MYKALESKLGRGPVFDKLANLPAEKRAEIKKKIFADRKAAGKQKKGGTGLALVDADNSSSSNVADGSAILNAI